jgi:hypothetical protein
MWESGDRTEKQSRYSAAGTWPAAVRSASIYPNSQKLSFGILSNMVCSI